MKSKGFKIIVGVLVAVIVVLGGLLVVKTVAPAEMGQPATSSGEPIPDGAVEDITFSEAPSASADEA